MTKKINKESHPDYFWCKEKNRHVHKDDLIKLRDHGIRYLYHGRGNISFVVIEDYGFTIVKTFGKKNKDFCSNYWFNGKPELEEIKARLFDGSRHYTTIERRSDKHYGVIYRYGIIPAEDWSATYEPNVVFTKYKTIDRAFKSLSKCISTADGGEILCETPYKAFGKASRRIRTMRKSFIEKSDDEDLPVVEVYAIWSNYDPETSYIIQNDYDAFEPLHYTFNRFNSLTQMAQHPM